MTRHKVLFSTTDDIEVANTDFEFQAFVDRVKLGTLKISRGTVDWLPAGRGKLHFVLNWTDLAAVMEQQGRRQRKSARPSSTRASRTGSARSLAAA